MVLAKLCGSFTSNGSGRPCPTSQNGQRRVHLSPMIMNVAVPLPKHSPIFGHEASSHTVNNSCSRRIFLISPKRVDEDAAFTRIHSGFFRVSLCSTLTGMRDTLSNAFCFLVGSYAVFFSKESVMVFSNELRFNQYQSMTGAFGEPLELVACHCVIRCWLKRSATSLNPAFTPILRMSVVSKPA